MCSCTTAKCAGCTCGCFHTPATRRAYWQGVTAARGAVAALIHPDHHDYWNDAVNEQALVAIDALRGDQ